MEIFLFLLATIFSAEHFDSSLGFGKTANFSSHTGSCIYQPKEAQSLTYPKEDLGH